MTKRSKIRASIMALAFATMAGCSGGSSGEDPDDGGTGGGSGGGGSGGGGGGSTPSALNIASSTESATYYNDVLTEFATVLADAGALDATIFADMPPLGTVTYNGYMNLIMGNATVSANVIGDTTLEARFGSGSITGSATDFLGVTTDENDNTHVAHYEGTVTIENGTIFAGIDGTTDLDIEINGELDNGLTVFGIDGNLVGGFNGPSAEGLSGLGSNTGLHGNVTATIDGVTATISIATVSAVTP